MRLIYEALTKAGSKTDAKSLISTTKGMKWESPCGPTSINPETRDVVFDRNGNAIKWEIVRSGGDPI